MVASSRSRHPADGGKGRGEVMAGPQEIAKDILVAVLSQSQSSLSLKDEPEMFGENIGKVYKKIVEAVIDSYGDQGAISC